MKALDGLDQIVFLKPDQRPGFHFVEHDPKLAIG